MFCCNNGLKWFLSPYCGFESLTQLNKTHAKMQNRQKLKKTLPI